MTAVETLNDFDAWRQETVLAPLDVSSRAYLDHLRRERALEVVESLHEQAVALHDVMRGEEWGDAKLDPDKAREFILTVAKLTDIEGALQ